VTALGNVNEMSIVVRRSGFQPAQRRRLTWVDAPARTVNVWAFEVPPPGIGLKTVIAFAPAVSVRRGMIAVSCVEETKVVVRSEPPNRTTETETNPVRTR